MTTKSRRNCRDWLRPECAGCIHLREWVADDGTPIEACAVLVFGWDLVVPRPHHVLARHAPCPPASALARVAEVEAWMDDEAGNACKSTCPVHERKVVAEEKP